jgi:hypothetical protein
VLADASARIIALPQHRSFSPQAALQATFFPVGVFPRPCILTNDTHGT